MSEIHSSIRGGGLRRLILVSPHFPPTNAPDHQRVRLSLPYWRECGWSPEVIAVEAAQVAAPHDDFLEHIIPTDVPVTRVKALSLRWGRLPGFGTLGYRCRNAIGKALRTALSNSPPEQPVTVYFSTTQFPIHSLIPSLKQQFPHVVFAMDYHDPWVSNFHCQHAFLTPPGGRLKYALVQKIARKQEPRTLRHISGITTVSARYREQICERNPWFKSVPWIELPFGGAASDFDALKDLAPTQSHYDPHDGNIHWVYVGRGGRDLEPSVRALCRALRLARTDRPEFRRVHLHFLGTDYAPPALARRTLLPIAVEEGIGDFAHENPVRLPYGEALRCMVDAHALVVPGSQDAGYSASKIYPCVLARRPLLAIFHHASPIHCIMQATRAGVALGFDATTSTDELARSIRRAWMETGAYQAPSSTDWSAFDVYSDRSMTKTLSQFLTGLTPSLKINGNSPGDR